MNISITPIVRTASAFFKRYHFIIFIVYIMGSASFVVLLINQTISLSDESNGYTSQENNISFDEDTISRLRALKDSNETTEKLPVSGRVSPF